MHRSYKLVAGYFVLTAIGCAWVIVRGHKPLPPNSIAGMAISVGAGFVAAGFVWLARRSHKVSSTHP